MKNINIISLFIIILLGISSCDDWLDVKPYDKIESSLLYETQDGLETAVVGIKSLSRQYFRFLDSPETRANYWFYCAADMSITRTYNEANLYQSGMLADNSLFESLWLGGYELIDRSSLIITNARNVDMLPSEKTKIISEAKVIRAMVYLRLITVYDNILLDTIPTTGENAFDEVDFTPATKQQIHDLINADLDYAIKNLDYNVKLGGISKGLAQQLRAESAMWIEDWEDAAMNCDAIIESDEYKLVDIRKVMGNDPVYSDRNSEETIFLWLFDELTGNQDNYAGGTGHNLGAPFQSRFYEIEIPGEVAPIIEDNTYGGNAFGWNLPNDYLRSLYDEKNDLRMDYYFYPDTLYVNNPASPRFGEPVMDTLPYSTQIRRYHWSCMKYRDFEKAVGENKSYKHVIAYRLAETYITGAEAHWRMGNDTKALEYINAIRSRAGVEGATAIDLQLIMDEQARELCFEGKRWFFLKRIGKLVEQFNAYHREGGDINSLRQYDMMDFHVRWPIPQSQIDVMGTFPQNPGY